MPSSAVQLPSPPCSVCWTCREMSAVTTWPGVGWGGSATRREQPGLLPSPLPCFLWTPSSSRAPSDQIHDAPSFCLVKTPLEETADLFCKASTSQATCRQGIALGLRPPDRAGHRPCPAGLGVGVTDASPNQSQQKGSTRSGLLIPEGGVGGTGACGP